MSDFIRPNKYEELLNYLEEKSENFVENVPYNRKYTLEYDPTKENENSPLMEFLEVKPFKGFHVVGKGSWKSWKVRNEIGRNEVGNFLMTKCYIENFLPSIGTFQLLFFPTPVSNCM